MAVFLNSVLNFNSSKLQATFRNGSQSDLVSTMLKTAQSSSPFFTPGLRMVPKEKTLSLCLSLANRDQLAADNSGNASKDTESLHANDQIPSSNPQDLDFPLENGQFKVNGNDESGSQTPKSSDDSPMNDQSETKRVPLKARDRLRAARVLNRYTDSKASKSVRGSSVLDALKESERGKKRSRLPEAPSNLFDDTKRGMPKQGLTFQFPGGTDLFFIVLSFVLISTLMFATTFLVWKVGAIHFNEY